MNSINNVFNLVIIHCISLVEFTYKKSASKKLKDELSDHETLKLAVKKVKVLPDDDSGLCVGDIQYLKNILTSQQWELIKTNRSSVCLILFIFTISCLNNTYIVGLL